MSHDPLTVLHGDDLPIQPDPAFAARLRRRLESALSLPAGTQGVTMSGTKTALDELIEEHRPEPTAPPRSAVLPYLTVADARSAITWYADAFGATTVGEPIVMDDGRIGHAELALAGGVLYLADEYPEIGLRAPVPGSTSVSLMLHVADTDIALTRARDRGARVEREPYENYGSRNAGIIDPFGHRWMLSGPQTGAATPIQHGDVGYVSVWTPDADRAATFYGHVLGWAYDPATHLVTNTRQRIGIFEVGDRRTLFCCYAVTDLDGARHAITAGRRAAGRGSGVRVRDRARCHRPAGQPPSPCSPRRRARRAPSSTALGRANFRTSPTRCRMRPHSARSSADCCSGRSSRAGSRTAGSWSPPIRWPGWRAAQAHRQPCRCGRSPTSQRQSTRVREAGGTVLQEPSRQPYGLTAECTDDQGARFYLGEF